MSHLESAAKIIRRVAARTAQNELTTPSPTTPLLTHNRQASPVPPIKTQVPKKKCRGDRKRQRYRRQFYAQGLDSVTVERLVKEKMASLIQQQQEQPTSRPTDRATNQESVSRNLNVVIPLIRVSHRCCHVDVYASSSLPQVALPDTSSGTSVDSIEMTPKRKRLVLTPTPTREDMTILDKPLSQLSISQRDPKRTRTMTTVTTTQAQQQSHGRDMVNNLLTTIKPRYLTVPDRVFRLMLSNAIHDGEKIVQCLDTTDKLCFVRRMTEITNDFYFKGLQRQLWQEYHSLSSTNQPSWQVKITKHYAQQHHTCRMYKPTESYIDERRKTIEHQLKQLHNELGTYLMQLEKNVTQWRPTIDPTALSHVINECVKKSQERLKGEFQHRIAMLKLDWNDHASITQFYELKPSEQVIQLAKQLWQSTDDGLKMKDQLEILRQRIFLKRLPSKTDHAVNQLLDDETISLTNPFLEKDQRASFATRCSKTIIQCKFDLMLVQIEEMEKVIQCHNSKVASFQEQLRMLKTRSGPSLPMNSWIDAIEQRRQTMIDRLFCLRQHKLKSFFDQAPTMDNSN